MLCSLLVTFFFLLGEASAALQSSDLTEQHVIDFLTDGHVLLRNILPELRDESFRQEYEHAKVESSKAYEKFFIDHMGCDQTEFAERVEAGDGAQVIKDCVDYIFRKEGGMTDEDLHTKPFYQIVNLHEYSEKIHNVAVGPRLAAIVSDLLRVEKVRLYQTRSFRKVPQEDDTMRILFNHPTFMHADLSMVPLDTNEYLTLWCPSRNLTLDDSVLTYASGSHRDIAASHWHDKYEDDEEEEEEEEAGEHEEEREEYEEGEDDVETEEGMGNPHNDADAEAEALRLEEEGNEVNFEQSMRYNIAWYDDLSVGDCVAHHGWLLHGATSQVFANGPRDALTFAYIDGDSYKLASGKERHAYDFLEPQMAVDAIMFRDWFFDIPDGELADHPKLPLVWPTQQENHDISEATPKVDADPSCVDNTTFPLTLCQADMHN